MSEDKKVCPRCGTKLNGLQRTCAVCGNEFYPKGEKKKEPSLKDNYTRPWKCECGEINEGTLCDNCGKPRGEWPKLTKEDDEAFRKLIRAENIKREDTTGQEDFLSTEQGGQ